MPRQRAFVSIVAFLTSVLAELRGRCTYEASQEAEEARPRGAEPLLHELPSLRGRTPGPPGPKRHIRVGLP